VVGGGTVPVLFAIGLLVADGHQGPYVKAAGLVDVVESEVVEDLDQLRVGVCQRGPVVGEELIVVSCGRYR
jgi:hypothetical protein